MRQRHLFGAGLLVLALLGPSIPATGAGTAAVEPVRMNQLGFQPSAVRRAIVETAGKKPLPWQLVDDGGTVRLHGQTIVLGPDQASGQSLHLVDFSRLKGTGKYRLKVGDMMSRTFEISPDIYNRLTYDALAYFYHNRAGVPIEAQFAGGEQWRRPAGHKQEVASCFEGADERGNAWPGCDYKLDVTGGWYDAGDHGKYVVNAGISLWTLLNLYERQEVFRRPSPFQDGQVRIPEAGNGVNDLLDHARFQMEFLLKMQVPDGKQLSVPVGQKDPGRPLTFTRINASGMAHHKVADAKWTSLPMYPHKDPEPRIPYPPSTAATLNLAANAAQCGRLWRGIDAAFANRCLAAAEKAYAAALRNPEVYAVGSFTGSGAYGDDDLSDEFYWAAAELFATTGREEYRTALRRSRHFARLDGEPSWPNVGALGTLTLALASRDNAAKEISRQKVMAAAERFLKDRERVGYRIPYATNSYPWGSNSSVLNRAIILAAAFDFSRDKRFRDGVVDAMDYILGRNPLDQSYVSGYGARPMRNPHHRVWAQMLDPSMPPPPPGALSGGPNNMAMSDEIAVTLKGKCAPQTCWRDDTRSYALNEVAINWNAPLVWVAAFLDEPIES